MSPTYRDRRKRRLRVIAALLAISLIAPSLLVAVDALRSFGAGLILLSLIGFSVLAYTLAGRQSSDEET